jgi:hypothetical protein
LKWQNQKTQPSPTITGTIALTITIIATATDGWGWRRGWLWGDRLDGVGFQAIVEPRIQRRVRFASDTGQLSQCSELTRCAMCGRLRVGKENLHVAGLDRLRPCVRPVSAVRMTAGHNALRGSGPGQKLAFADAVALVGCPDRRIDRLCITCCSPSNFYITPVGPARSRSHCERGGFLVALTLCHQGPSHSRNLVGKRDCGHLCRPPRQ